MTPTLTVTDSDSARAVYRLLSALQATGALTDHEEQVAQELLEQANAEMPLDSWEAADALDDEVAEVRDRLETALCKAN